MLCSLDDEPEETETTTAGAGVLSTDSFLSHSVTESRVLRRIVKKDSSSTLLIDFMFSQRTFLETACLTQRDSENSKDTRKEDLLLDNFCRLSMILHDTFRMISFYKLQQIHRIHTFSLKLNMISISLNNTQKLNV